MCRFPLVALIALASVLLSGCQSAPKGGTSSSGATSALPGSGHESASVQRKARAISAFGTYLHAGSKLAFPAVAAGVDRVAVIAYDPAESDVSANYDFNVQSAGKFRLSVYIYPGMVDAAASTQTDQGCLKHFDDVVYSARMFFPDKISNYEKVKSPLDPEKTGYHAVLEATHRQALKRLGIDGALPSRSEVYLFCDVESGWLLKYRITYPAQIDARPLIAAIMQAVPLKGM